MRATITDPQTIDAISPVDLASYLRIRGWHRGPEIAEGLAQIWLWPLSDSLHPESADVILPGYREMRDFRRRVSETLQTLEQVEGRSQLDILSDIQSVSSDIIRWRWIEANSEDGTIPLEQGHQFFSQVRNQLLAAACSAIHPSQFFASRKPVAALDFLREARLGQSERGSYVVTVHNPVPPALATAELDDDSEPFERRVTLTLSRAMQSLRRVTAETVSGGQSPSAAELSRDGVSANLCESVAAMLDARGIKRDIEVRFSFAGSRPPRGSAPALTRFSSDLSPVIGEIGKMLRENAPRDNFELIGFVTDLSRGPHDVNGTAILNDYRLEAGRIQDD
jgi:hypothetical protein